MMIVVHDLNLIVSKKVEIEKPKTWLIKVMDSFFICLFGSFENIIT